MRSSETILVYGISGVGKTTQVGELAEWVHKKTGKRTRLVSASGGGWGTIQHLVDAGIVEPFYIVGYPHPYATMHRLSQGWWPPRAEPSPPAALRPPKDQPDFDEIGLWAFESMTEIAEAIMRYTVESEAQGRIKVSGQSPAAKWSEDKEFFGSASMSMYGTIQNYIGQFVSQSSRLPGLVLWTALELRAVDENSRLPVYGPEIVGKAKTSQCPAWFTQVLHLHFETVKNDVHRRLYLEKHAGDDGIIFLAKNTARYRRPLPQFLEGDDLSLGKFMDLLDESRKV